MCIAQFSDREATRMNIDYEKLAKRTGDGGVEDRRHNFAYLQAVVGGTERVLAEPLQFDPRAEYWSTPGRRFFVHYFANRYPVWPSGEEGKALGEFALSISKLVDRLRDEGLLKDLRTDEYENAGGLEVILRPLHDAFSKLDPVPGWSAFRGKRDKSPNAAQSLLLHLEDVHRTGFGASESLAPTMRWFGFLGAQDLKEAEARQAFFFHYGNALTANNTYRHGGALSFGSIIRNTETGVFLGALQKWRDSTPSQDVEILTKNRTQEIPSDARDYSIVKEIWGLLNLERGPFVNEQARPYCNPGESLVDASERVGKETQAWLESHPELIQSLSAQFAAELDSADHGRKKPFVWARGHKKGLMTTPLDIRLEADLQSAARDRLASKSERDRAAMMLHLAMDTDVYDGKYAAGSKVSEPVAQYTAGEEEDSLLAPNQRIWLYAPGPKASNWPADSSQGKASLGWAELADFSTFESQEQMFEALLEWQDSEAKPRNSAKYCWDFGHRIQVGDTIVARRGRSSILGIGQVTGAYTHDPTESEYPHKVAVKWSWIGTYSIADKGTLPMQTLVDASARTALWNEIQEALFSTTDSIKSPEPESEEVDSYSLGDALSDLFFDKAFVQKAQSLLERKKNLILQGPPGVGKTFFARRLAFLLMGERATDRVKVVQFHQAYTYEHFVRGYVPKEGGGFGVRNGTLYKLAETAKADPGNDYVLIIDEINRGNLSKIFGETLMLVEADKRDPSWAASLGYGDDSESFYLPKNLHVIGTMNTADRSLALVDYALRRRFVFAQLTPNFTHDRFAEHLASLPKGTVPRIRSAMERLNEMIRKDLNLGAGFEIGHSYFCLETGDLTESETTEWLRAIIDYELRPMIEEYWFDDPDQMEEAAQILETLLP